MTIPPSTVITLCDNTPSSRSQFNGLAFAEAYKGATFQVQIRDVRYYIAFTFNTKNLFYDDEYLGGMITIRKKGENSHSAKLENYTFFVHAEAVGLSTNPGSVLLSPIGNDRPMLFWNKDDINEIRHQYRFIYAEQYEKNPTEFEMNWGKFIANKPDFHYYSGRLTF